MCLVYLYSFFFFFIDFFFFFFCFFLFSFFFFFFSSRRRHTRWTGDWSSDVCSSDLELCIRTRSRVVSSEKNLGRVERIRRDIQKIVGRLTVGVGITGTRSAACPVDVVVRRTGVPGIDEGDIGVGWKPVGTGRNDLVRHIVLRPRCVLVEQIATYVALKAEV